MYRLTTLLRCTGPSYSSTQVRRSGVQKEEVGWRASRTTTNHEVPPRLRTGLPSQMRETHAAADAEPLRPTTTQFTYASMEKHANAMTTAAPLAKDSVTSIVKKTAIMAYDPNEHALLCNLDESDDAVLYGTGEQFHENVQRMRRIILTHHIWTVTETWYTILCYILYAAVAYLCFHAFSQRQMLHILRDSREAYARSCQHAMNASRHQRKIAAERCIALLNDFESRKDLREIRKRMNKKSSKDPVDPLEVEQHKRAVEELQIHLRRLLLPSGEDYHAVVRTQMKAYYETKQRQLVHPE